MAKKTGPRVGIIMGSVSDLETMRPAANTLAELLVSHEMRVVSAHRTPDLLFDYATTAAARGLRVIIAGAGGAAHLPGMTAAKTQLPVIGVPVRSAAFFAPGSPMASEPTGTPAGICAMESSESRPFKARLSTGTPRTGSVVNAAAIPGRCAAPPAPAMMT